MQGKLAACGKVVVIGASRGIGLGFVKEFLGQGHTVYATYRELKKNSELSVLKEAFSDKLNLIQLDVTDEEGVKQLSTTISGFIDTLILNAGIMESPSGSHPLVETTEEMRRTMEVNTIAPDHIIRTLFPKLEHPNSVTMYISSTLSSYACNLKGRWNSYRGSKAAANIIMQNWNAEMATAWIEKGLPLEQRPCIFPISPGTVQTDMGNGKGDLTVEQSVSQMVKVIDKVREHKHCSLYLYDGSILEKYPEPLVLSEACQKKTLIGVSSLDTAPQSSSNHYSFHKPDDSKDSEALLLSVKGLQ